MYSPTLDSCQVLPSMITDLRHERCNEILLFTLRENSKNYYYYYYYYFRKEIMFSPAFIYLSVFPSFCHSVC